MSFIKDTYPHVCPLHVFVKDIQCTQAQKGQVEEIPLNMIFQKRKSNTSKITFVLHIPTHKIYGVLAYGPKRVANTFALLSGSQDDSPYIIRASILVQNTSTRSAQRRLHLKTVSILFQKPPCNHTPGYISGLFCCQCEC